MARYIDADRIVVDAIKERKFVIQIQDMLNPEIIIRTAYADLEDFSDDLKEAVKYITEKW